ncbi:uncharacterized protein KY384_007949 [Bacidia gigantensis]|uniref:uncharacterized protein n=1 Tax=Bacidia gigantensis TaxID=2732470 RepID=UPI001D049EE0|nr:uncharacterized protein KY384_007949 [Bacidia gigantensis]KAG8527795.1 hypothetical protein KY384_007949 [Bacidia gigantensis]
MTTIDETELQKLRDANTKGIVLGLKAFASVKPRLDIDDLLAQLPKAFNLFLIALDDLQKDKSKTGYAQIAVIDLARSFTGSLKDDYLREALQFRLPYWDYYRPRGGPVEFPGVIDKGTTTFDWDYSIPRVFTEKSLRVRRPPGNQIDTLERNPLNFFDLKSANIIPDDDWKMYGKVDLFPRDRTVRYRLPNSTSDTDSTTVANSTINELRMDSNRLMLNMLSNKETDVYNNYDVFSTNKKGTPTVAKPPQDAKEAEKTMWYGSGSLEALHGIYHVIIGGLPNINTKTWAGHMTQVPVAAFDPIFPEEWFGNQSLSTKPLLPFRIKNDNNDPTVCWNSNQSRQCGTFGYDYPEILAGGDVLTTVRKMYEWSVNLTAAGDFGDIPSNMKPAPISNAEIWLPGATSDLLSATNPGRPKAPKPQFFAQMRTQNIALPPAEVALSREWYIDDEVER